ncbi:MAG: hypothetical protein LIP12_14000 [Clostridiales bacterium]|nr:hypothetical protein [Clostridiales bacterium]
MNIPKLQAIDKEYRGIDNFYNSIIGTEGSGLKKLIQTLSGSGSKYKMAQLGEALTSEYLRNVGYDIPKPDTHIRRILGRGILGCSDAETVSVFEAFDIISEIAQVMNWPLAKVDYILWSYCADGYGEICTVHPKCDQCIANKVSEYCVKGKNYGSKEKNSNENLYLLFCNYGIKPNDSCPEIIKKVAYKSFASFCRRISFYDSASLDERNKAVKDTDELLAERIPVFLKAVQTENDSQEFFDQKHKELCGEMIQLFEPAGGLTYGIAQRWLNQTLQNLTVVDCNMPVASLPVADTKKYYHVPVEPAVLSVAAGKRKGRFEHELCIPCAPLKHNEPMVYQMDWYVSGRMQPFEKWEYPEYMDFQKAVRNRLAELASSQDGAFMTPLDWAFCAALEAAQPRYSL